MDARLKSLLTLAGLGLLLVVAASWGINALTAPLPGDEDSDAICIDREVAAGEKVRRSDVTVSVLNGGTRNGLAGLTMDLLTDAGFGQGQEGNLSEKAKVDVVQIWTTEPKHPAVRLVASQFGETVRVVRREPSTAGVQVVVGDGFEQLSVDGARSVKARGAVTVCGPPDGV